MRTPPTVIPSLHQARLLLLLHACLFLNAHAWILGYHGRSGLPIAASSSRDVVTNADPSPPINRLEGSIPRILLETDLYLVIDKPWGMSHHSTTTEDHTRSVTDTNHDGHPPVSASQLNIVPGILAHLRRLQSDGLLSYQGRLFGVHRLDQVTSGILVLAKDVEAARFITNTFRHGTAVKCYVGLSCRPHKAATKKQGWIKGGMQRGRRKSWYLTRRHETNTDDKNNIHDDTNKHVPTNYAVTRFFTSGLGSLQPYLAVEPDMQNVPRTLLLFRPYTGRTHQLRVAAKSVGLPLLGDPLYSDTSASSTAARSARATSKVWNGVEPTIGHRTYLHATALHIPLPSLSDDGDHLTVFSPPPFDEWWNFDEEEGPSLFQQQVTHLFDKHCEDNTIRNLVRDYWTTTQS